MSNFQLTLELDDTLAKIRKTAIGMAAQKWDELGIVLDENLPSPIDPFFLLPIATGRGCEGAVEHLIPISAIIVLLNMSLRILDDSADGDNPTAIAQKIGTGRAVNYAIALTTIANSELLKNQLPNNGLEMLNYYHHSFLQVCVGQNRDLQNKTNSLEEYKELIKLKTLPAYEFAAVSGAKISISEERFILHSAACGKHLGWMTQILDDIESLWFPVLKNDCEITKKTYPLLLALNLDHPNAIILERLLAGKEYNRTQICSLLDEMKVRELLLNFALDHRDEALKSIGNLPNPEGKLILKVWLDWYLSNGETLLK